MKNNIFVENREDNLRYEFDSLEDKCLYYRSLTSTQKLTPNSYVMLMLDGHTFSSKIKKRFKLPFDDLFIKFMNETAAYVCSEVQGAKLAFVQSDEISILLTDFETEETSPFYDYRLCKILSIVPALATAYFNRTIVNHLLETPCSPEDMKAMIAAEPLYEFDCKCWLIPDTVDYTGTIISTAYNNVFAWFLYRQIDCIRNSKQQAAQTYCSHKSLLGKHTDEQLQILKDKTGIDWNTEYDDGKKFGRFIYKEKVKKQTVIKGETVEYERSVWQVHNGLPLTEERGKKMWESFTFIPQKKTKTQAELDREKIVKHLSIENPYDSEYLSKLIRNVMNFYDMCIREGIYISTDDINKYDADEDFFMVTIKSQHAENKIIICTFIGDFMTIDTGKLWCQVHGKKLFVNETFFDEVPYDLMIPFFEIKNNTQYTK